MTTFDPPKPGLLMTRRPGDVLIIEVPPDAAPTRFTIAVTAIARREATVGLDIPRNRVVTRGETVGLRLQPKRPRRT